MKSIFSHCTGSSFHKSSKASILSEMLGTFMVLEPKGISHHSNSGEDTESKALWRILLRLKKINFNTFLKSPKELWEKIMCYFK